MRPKRTEVVHPFHVHVSYKTDYWMKDEAWMDLLKNPPEVVAAELDLFPVHFHVDECGKEKRHNYNPWRKTHEANAWGWRMQTMAGQPVTLRAMGVGQPETFRCRVYGGEDEEEDRRRAFVNALATEGVLEAPVFDKWLKKLDSMGWVFSELIPIPNSQSEGKYKRWKLNEFGQQEWEKLK